MHVWLTILLLVAQGAAAQPATRAEAEAILRTPLAATVGEAEAQRVMRLAVGNGILLHCRWAWQRGFEALTDQHRVGLRRDEAGMQRLTIWHGFWQGQGRQVAQQDGIACDPTLRDTLRRSNEALLRQGPAR